MNDDPKPKQHLPAPKKRPSALAFVIANAVDQHFRTQGKIDQAARDQIVLRAVEEVRYSITEEMIKRRRLKRDHREHPPWY